MITLAKSRQITAASAANIFALWADIDHWAKFDDGIEWAKLTDSFNDGGHYTIKPKGGPMVKATILAIEQNKRFVNVSHLFGARLTFDHVLSEQGELIAVDITMTLEGRLAFIWAKILGKNQQTDLEKSTANLIRMAESNR